jgi:hypothetical protein
MSKLLYVYQNYRESYSSASLSILRGLRKINEIILSDFEIKPISYNNKINRVLNKLPFLQHANFKRQNDLLEKIVDQGEYDFMFVMKGTDLKAVTLKRIKINNPSIKLICFNPDDPFNKASSNSDILATIPLYDYYCIWTKYLDNQLLEAGAKQIIYLPFGIDNEIIYPVEAAYQYDISFVGNGDAERHQLIESLNGEIIKRGLDYKIHIFGSNWPFMGEKVLIHGQRNGIELLKTISASKINLNLLRKQNKNSINMRTFEIPAANGFMMHEESEEAKIYFSDSVEVVYFKSIDDLVTKCEFYLIHENERYIAIKNCYKRIACNDYSYKSFLKSRLTCLLDN